MKRLNIILITVLLLILTGSGATIYLKNFNRQPTPKSNNNAPSQNYEEDSSQEETKEDTKKQEDTKRKEKQDGEIILESPQEEEIVTSPLTVEGRARGTWYFEGSFPVVLTNWDGLIISETQAKAQEEWMTEDFVPFEAELTFEKPDTDVSNKGFLILQKSNPSGRPKMDDALEITVFFKEN